MSDMEFDLSAQIEAEQKVIQQKQAVAKYNEKVDQLSEKIIYHMQQKTAVSEQVVEILLPFLEVAIEMQGIIEIITSVNEVVQLIGEAINLLDTTMQSSQNAILSTTQVKYGWFQKLKRKIQQRAAINNNRRRAEAIADSLVGHYEMAMALAGSFKQIPDRLHGAMDKLKRSKRGKGNKDSKTHEKYQMSDNLRKVLTDKGADLDGMGYSSGGGSSSSGFGGGSSSSGAPSSDSGNLSDGL